MSSSPGPAQAELSALLKYCFWKAMRHCGDDDRVHDMDYPYNDDPLIDGRLPDVLWEYMADILTKTKVAELRGLIIATHNEGVRNG